MNIEVYREYCLSLKAVTEDFPFDTKTLVFRVGGKMFALCNVENFDSINLKCEPEKALELREKYTAVQPGYHMNKKHWNTIAVQEDVSVKLLKELIDHSYNLVFLSLSKKVQAEITGV